MSTNYNTILHFIHIIYIYIYIYGPSKDKFMTPPLILKLFISYLTQSRSCSMFSSFDEKDIYIYIYIYNMSDQGLMLNLRREYDISINFLELFLL